MRELVIDWILKKAGSCVSIYLYVHTRIYNDQIFTGLFKSL